MPCQAVFGLQVGNMPGISQCNHAYESCSPNTAAARLHSEQHSTRNEEMREMEGHKAERERGEERSALFHLCLVCLFNQMLVRVG